MIMTYLKPLFTSFSYLVLSGNLAFGVVLFLISFVNISSGVLALVAYLSLLVFGKLMGLSREQMVGGMYTYNSLLVGLAMGYLFKITILSLVFTVLASFFSLLLSFTLHSIFSYYLRVPILNLPFTITATLVYLSSIRYGNLYTVQNTRLGALNIEQLPIWLSGLFRSTGIILFLPYDLIGIAVLLSMLVFSRINFFLAVTGYYTGTMLLTLLKGSSYSAFTDLYSFNFILIALALGGLFLIPSVKTYIIALAGVLVSVFILDAVDILWSGYGIPAFAFPFVIVVCLLLYILITNRFPLVTTAFFGTPESNLEHYINYTARFNQSLPQPCLPFSGEWTVYQGFNGEWTHKGCWAHAVDFVVQDSEGRAFKGAGKALEDYYSYNKPVLSPVNGKVVEVWNECADNVIGTVDEQNNWGNFVIIYSDWGYYVEISHLLKGSINVRAGEYVIQGQIIGRCGNSGYSPQPHIHIQCQQLPHTGAPTIPFAFTNYIMDGQCWFGVDFPLMKGKTLRPISRSRVIEQKLRFVLGESFTYNIVKNGIRAGDIKLRVGMAPDGSYYLGEQGRDTRLFFSNREGMFTFYRFEGGFRSPLRYFYLALPRVPLTDERVKWNDDINFALVQPHPGFSSFIKSFNHRIFSARGSYFRESNETVTGGIEVRTPMGLRKLETLAGFDLKSGISSVIFKTENEKTEIYRGQI
ncbi:MAG: peptidoglycan DD-metalloendopeptidase family protein [Fibrobacter sp.]|nr:peptidoglycan DD-metalloendopeptidase family protein [Fibrobacter sp.]